MKLLLILVLTNLLTGCAQMIVAMGDNLDQADMCQARFREPGYQIPPYCGASGGRTTIYNPQGRVVGYIK